MNVSVVISTYSVERFNDVMECLESLSKQTLPPSDIILSLDPDDELVEFYSSRIPSYVKIVVTEKKGLSNARNAGIKRASGNIVAFIDDDACADKDWLKNLIKNYEDSDVWGVGGLINPIWENGRPRWFPDELDWIVGCSYKGLPDHKACVRNPIGCNMSFKKTVFDKVGYFKSNVGRQGKKLLGGEEPELSLRLLDKISNAKIIYDPLAIVHHKVPKSRSTLKYFMNRSFYEGVSKRIMKSLLKSKSIKVLSVENQYLKYLLKVSIPSRLLKIHKLDNILQVLMLILSMSLVLMGYFLPLS